MNKREYERNGKPILHQSNLKEYFACPKKYKFSINPEFAQCRETTEAQNNGLLVESYLWGFKGETPEEVEQYKLLLESFGGTGLLKSGKLSAKWIKVSENAQKCAEIMGKHFPDNEEPFFKIEFEDDNFIYEGEIDSFTPELFSDLKVTTDMPTVWGFMNWRGELEMPTKMDMLQPLYYIWIWYKLNGSSLKELPKWVFKIIDWNNHSVKTFPVTVTKWDFNFLEERIIDFQSDLFFSAKPSHKNCLRNKWNAKCPYLKVCYEGLEFSKGEIKEIDFSNFNEII